MKPCPECEGTGGVEVRREELVEGRTMNHLVHFYETECCPHCAGTGWQIDDNWEREQ